MALTLRTLWEENEERRPWKLAAASTAGLCLIHYRVMQFYACFVVAIMLVLVFMYRRDLSQTAHALVEHGARHRRVDACRSTAGQARQAAEHGRALDHELAHLVVHGVLHLLGHDHAEPEEEARMRAREDEVLHACGFPSGSAGWDDAHD
ncbi:MAG: rRNA maturation RNase YbeY [Anaerolineae bacterium]|nr:rRNA maturation RNase YbeY [Anaerolineae bacterium]